MPDNSPKPESVEQKIERQEGVRRQARADGLTAVPEEVRDALRTLVREFGRLREIREGQVLRAVDGLRQAVNLDIGPVGDTSREAVSDQALRPIAKAAVRDMNMLRYPNPRDPLDHIIPSVRERLLGLDPFADKQYAAASDKFSAAVHGFLAQASRGREAFEATFATDKRAENAIADLKKNVRSFSDPTGKEREEALRGYLYKILLGSVS